MTPTLTHQLAGPTVVHLDDLGANWGTLRAAERGYYRWLISYFGGREGYTNANPESGLISERSVVGLMGMPAGNEQPGYHHHSIAEIYVILRGRVESRDGGDERHIAGPGDCLYMPPGAAHGVRAVGREDALFLWVHDAIEANGTSVYYDQVTEAGPRVDFVRSSGLETALSLPRGETGGYLRSVRRIVGRAGITQPAGRPSIDDTRVTISSITLTSGNRQPPFTLTAVATFVVVAGHARALDCDQVLAPLDALIVPPGDPVSLAVSGVEPLEVLCIVDDPAPAAAYQPG